MRGPVEAPPKTPVLSSMVCAKRWARSTLARFRHCALRHSFDLALCQTTLVPQKCFPLGLEASRDTLGFSSRVDELSGT